MLIDRDWVIAQLGLQDADGDNVDFCIEWVQSRAENYIGRKLESDTYTWYLDGTGGKTIILPICPITSLTSISLDSSRLFTTNLSESDYYCDLETGIIQLYRKTTTDDARTVKVVAVAGYTSDTLPGDLKMAFLSAISHHMAKLVNRAFGMSSQTSPDGVNMSYELELPSDTKRVFDSYREVNI